MDSTAQGGVVNLLRMARTQCGVAVAFAALRNADGSFALATSPQLGGESEWTIDAVDDLAHQVWNDPHLGSGRVLVRSARLPGSEWPGENHQVKMAVAPLSDLTAEDRPWGLLCLADPASAQFEQSHLELLGSMAVRLTSYLRARQEIVENVFSVVDDHPELAESSSARLGVAAVDDVAGDLRAEPAEVVSADVFEPAASGDLLDEPLQSADVFDPAHHGIFEELGEDLFAHADDRLVEQGSGRLRDDESGSDAAVPVEWYRGSTRSDAPVQFAGSTGENDSPPRTERTRISVERAPVPQPQMDDDAEAVLGSMLRPDPLTGLAGLPSVLVHLGSAVGELRRAGSGGVAVVLVDLRGVDPTAHPIPDSILSEVADQLTDRVRNGDLLGRIGQGTFAVVADVKSAPDDAPVIERRLTDAIRSVTSSSGITVRSTMTTVAPEAGLGAEDVLRRAIAQLGAR